MGSDNIALYYDHFISRRGWKGRQRYLDKFTVEDNSPHWIGWLPDNQRRLRHLIDTLDPVFILLQAMGFEVSDVYIKDNSLDHIRVDRQNMNVGVESASEDVPIPVIVFDDDPSAPPTEEASAYEYRGERAPRVSTSEDPAIAIRFKTTGFLGLFGTFFASFRMPNVRLYEQHGFLYIFPVFEGYTAATRLGLIVESLAIEVGSDAITPPPATIRSMIIDNMVSAATPVGDYPADAIDTVALQDSGLIWDPAMWLFPNLAEESVALLAQRVEVYRTIGDIVWPYVTQSPTTLREFLVAETAGFGAASEKVARRENGIHHLLSVALDHARQTAAPGARVHFLDPTEMIQQWIDATNDFAPTLDRQLAAATPKSLKMANTRSMTYTELLTTTYRHGAVNFRGSSSSGGFGFRLGTKVIPDELLGQMQAAGLGANEVNHPVLQELQLKMFAAWQTCTKSPRATINTLSEIRTHLDTTSRIYQDQIQADFLGTSRITHVINQAVGALQVMEAKLAGQHASYVFDQDDLWICFQYVGAALVTLDAVYVAADAQPTSYNFMVKFSAGFAEGVGPQGGNVAWQLFGRHQSHIGLQSVYFSIPLSAGIITGAAKHIDKTILDILKFLDDPAGGVAKIMNAVSQLLDTFLVDLAFVFGKAAGEASLKEMQKILKTETYWDYAFAIGELLGPLVLSVVLELLFEAYIFVPLMTGAMRVLRKMLRYPDVIDAPHIDLDADVIDVIDPVNRPEIDTPLNAPDPADLPEVTTARTATDALPADEAAKVTPDMDEFSKNIDPHETPLSPEPADPDLAVPEMNDVPPGSAPNYSGSTDEIIDQFDDTLGAQGVINRSLEGPSRDQVGRAINYDPNALHRGIKLFDQMPSEGRLAHVLQALFSSEANWKYVVALGKLDAPNVALLADDLAAAAVDGWKLFDALPDIIVKHATSIDNFNDVVSHLPPGVRMNWLTEKWYDAANLTAKIAGDTSPASLERAGLRRAAHRNSDVLRDRFHFETAEITDNPYRKIRDLSQAEFDALPADTRYQIEYIKTETQTRAPGDQNVYNRKKDDLTLEVADSAEGWPTSRTSKERASRSAAEVRAQAESRMHVKATHRAAETGLPSILDGQYYKTLATKLGDDFSGLVDDFLITGKWKKVDDALTEAGVPYPERKMMHDFIAAQYEWDGGHLIARFLGAEFAEVKNLIPVTARMNRSFQLITEFRIYRLIVKEGQGNVFLRVQVMPPWKNGVPAGVRYKAFKVDDTTKAITNILDEAIDVKSQPWVTEGYIRTMVPAEA